MKNKSNFKTQGFGFIAAVAVAVMGAAGCAVFRPVDAETQFKRGWNYEKGEGGVAQDYTKAVKWHRLAADNVHAEALKGIERIDKKQANIMNLLDICTSQAFSLMVLIRNCANIKAIHYN